MTLMPLTFHANDDDDKPEAVQGRVCCQLCIHLSLLGLQAQGAAKLQCSLHSEKTATKPVSLLLISSIFKGTPFCCS